MTGEELFLNELNLHIRSGISRKDLTGLINERIKQLILSGVGSSLPNVYENEHNSARIKFYQHLAKTMKVNVYSVRHIFNEGCDWYKSLI